MEEKINEAQVSEVEIKHAEKESEEKGGKKSSRFSDFYVEAILFLILGLLIGFAVKTEAAKKITMGFDDYKMKIFKEGGYDINELEKEQIQKSMAQAAEGTQEEQPAATEGSCQ